MRTFHITAEIDAPDFDAESEEEARELFWESISDKYGIASSILNLEIVEQRGLSKQKKEEVMKK